MGNACTGRGLPDEGWAGVHQAIICLPQEQLSRQQPTERSKLAMGQHDRRFVCPCCTNPGRRIHQRQFQSVNSNYAGFGLNLGFERSMDRIFDLKGLVRYSVLGGPGSANATEILILGGITFPFSF